MVITINFISWMSVLALLASAWFGLQTKLSSFHLVLRHDLEIRHTHLNFLMKFTSWNVSANEHILFVIIQAYIMYSPNTIYIFLNILWVTGESSRERIKTRVIVIPCNWFLTSSGCVRHHGYLKQRQFDWQLESWEAMWHIAQKEKALKSW